MIPVILIIALFGYMEYYVYKIGESAQVERILEAMEDNREQYWFGEWFSDALFVKFNIMKERKAEVLVLGGSRANQFRKGMFEPYTFYNAGNTAATFSAAEGLIKDLGEGGRPKVLILGLDPFNFKKTEPKSKKPDDWNSIESRLERPDIYKKVLGLWKETKGSIKWIFDKEAGTKYLGVRAYRSKRGVRSIDGSVSYGDLQDMSIKQQQVQYDSKKSKAHKALSAKGMFKGFGDQLSENGFSNWQKLVKSAAEMGTTVVGVTVPFSKPYQEIMDADPEKYPWWNEFQDPATTAKLRENGAIYFNFSYLDLIEADELMMIDLMHPSEPSIALVVAKMMENPAMKNILPDLDVRGFRTRVNKVVKSNPTGEVFPFEFD